MAQVNSQTITSIIISYFIFLLLLTVLLTDMREKNLLDDYGNYILETVLIPERSDLSTTFEEQTQKLREQQQELSNTQWSTLLFIVQKALEFIDIFFNIISKIFSMLTTFLQLIGINNTLLIQLLRIGDLAIMIYIIRIYVQEVFK